MGHVTTDRIEEAWRQLKIADNLIEAGQTYAGVLKCETALEKLYQSAKSVDEHPWFAKIETQVRDDIFSLKRNTVPDAERVSELVMSVRELAQTTRTKIVPIINERLDYETEAHLSEVNNQ